MCVCADKMRQVGGGWMDGEPEEKRVREMELEDSGGK